LENNHHRNCTKDSLRLLNIYYRKITGDDFNRQRSNCNRKRLRQLQLRMLGTKVVDTDKIPGTLAVNRQRTGDHLLGVIFQRSKSNSVGTRNFWMLH
jgi:hypothetical protein